MECRICQDEDMDSNMEAPCACCGSLKYAHRRCVQRWCNEKGDTICEICHQPFRPGYTAPPSIFRLGGIPMNLRGNWRIVRRNLNNQRVIAVVSTDHNLINSDENEVYTSRCMMCCRVFAIIFMLLLVIRNTLPLIVDQAGDYSLPLVMLLLLRVMGIVLPVYVIMKAVISCHHRQHQQATLPISSSREEASLVTLQQEPPITAIQWMNFRCWTTKRSFSPRFFISPLFITLSSSICRGSSHPTLRLLFVLENCSKVHEGWWVGMKLYTEEICEENSK